MFSRAMNATGAVAAVGLTAVALAGCGGGDDGKAKGSATPTPGGGATRSVERTITGGTTTLRLDPTMRQILETLGVEVTTVGQASATDGRITLPIERGTLDLRSDTGRIVHGGGLRFTAGGRSVTATDLVLSPDKGRITGVVDGRRVPLFSVALQRARTVPQSDAIAIPGNASVLSTAVLPESVRGGLAGTAFKRGLRIGSLHVSAEG